MAITSREKCVTFTINTRLNFTNYFFRNFDRLSIYDTKVDWVSADYNGYYIQESGKSDKYGFFLVPVSMRLDMFLNSSTKFQILG